MRNRSVGDRGVCVSSFANPVAPSKNLPVLIYRESDAGQSALDTGLQQAVEAGHRL